MEDLKWEDVSEMERFDLFLEMEEIAANAEERVAKNVYGQSESYSWARYAEAVRAAIRKLKEK